MPSCSEEREMIQFTGSHQPPECLNLLSLTVQGRGKQLVSQISVCFGLGFPSSENGPSAKRLRSFDDPSVLCHINLPHISPVMIPER
ncbi:hypothetical protein PROFUN_11319 [Planoprotostelium fungivorum]|uniref:Uncharacterized protein n=1 Tax=Planoprotostelium fungivorum TaxID=1890364 RepID=A0A2P6N2K6_9EUKA|nr:hypothetical protein PROFUN_11319 [Planoprotostelium fungivorum]